MYQTTSENAPPTVLVVLGHPSPLMELSQKSDKLIHDWQSKQLTEYSHLGHLNAKLFVDHLVAELTRDSSNNSDKICIEPSNILRPSEPPVHIEILQLGGIPRNSTTFPNGIELLNSPTVVVRYREVYLKPIEGEEEWRFYFQLRWPIGDGSDDESLIRYLIKESRFMVCPPLYEHTFHQYPTCLVFHLVRNCRHSFSLRCGTDHPARSNHLLTKHSQVFFAVPNFHDRLSAEFFELIPSHFLINSIMWWIGRLAYPLGCVRRFMARYSSQGLLRDKGAAIVQTKGGADPIVSHYK